MLFGVQYYLVWNKIFTKYCFQSSFTTSKWIKVKHFLLLFNQLTIGERPENKNIESHNLTQKK